MNIPFFIALISSFNLPPLSLLIMNPTPLLLTST